MGQMPAAFGPQGPAAAGGMGPPQDGAARPGAARNVAGAYVVPGTQATVRFAAGVRSHCPCSLALRPDRRNAMHEVALHAAHALCSIDALVGFVAATFIFGHDKSIRQKNLSVRVQ